MKRKTRILLPGIVFLCAAALLFAFHDRILWSLGAMLTNREPPQKAGMVVSIGGDYQGGRILKAAELVREGYAPSVLVSGSGGLYGYHEVDLEINFAVRHGYPRDTFIAFRYPALNTVEEARADIGEMRRLGVHNYLLVTSLFHSARASRIFRREGKDLEMHSVPASDPYLPNGVWWRNREGRKTWFFETAKTVADWFRI